MTNDPGAQPAETSLPGEPGAALPAQLQALAGTFTPAPWSPEVYGLTGPLGPGARSKDILFIAWRDLANRRAGGSEVLVDRLASGMLARGHRVTLLCGGPVAERPYRVVRNRGTFFQVLQIGKESRRGRGEISVGGGSVYKKKTGRVGSR